jgi:anti-sigma factor RsiW
MNDTARYFADHASLPVTEDDLNAYMDRELAPGRHSAVGRYLLAHPDVARRVEAYVAQRETLRAALAGPAIEPIPPQLDLQLLIRERRVDRHAQRENVWRIAASVLIAIGLAGAGGAGGWVLHGGSMSSQSASGPLTVLAQAAPQANGGMPTGQVSPSDQLLDEVADYHIVYARETIHQVEVPASQLAHIQAWLGDLLHRRLRVPDLSDRGLTFAGARLLVVAGKPVAQLLYHWPGREHEPLGLCIALGSDGDEGPRTDAREGVQQVLWRRTGYTYVLVGWTTPTILNSLANDLMPELDKQG